MAAQPISAVESARMAMSEMTAAQRMALMIEVVSQIRDPSCIQQLTRFADVALEVAEVLRRGQLLGASGDEF